jgi:hypothetical protein
MRVSQGPKPTQHSRQDRSNTSEIIFQSDQNQYYILFCHAANINYSGYTLQKKHIFAQVFKFDMLKILNLVLINRLTVLT